VHNTDYLHAFGNNAVEDEIRGLDENPGFPVEPRPEWAGFGELLEDFKPSPQSLVTLSAAPGLMSLSSSQSSMRSRRAR
jgi:hypothetical protein